MEILGLVDIPSWLLLTFLTLLLLYIFLTWTHNTFKKLGVPGPKTNFFFGTTLPFFLNLDKPIWKFDRELIETYGPFVGTFEGRRPVLVTSDLEAIKQVCIKDFNLFTNRQALLDPRVIDSPMDVGLTALTDDHWRHVRNLMSPAFTSGKLKRMMNQINKCADILVENLEEMAKKDEYVQTKEVSGCFTMDAIASTGFGLDINTQKDPDNPFIIQGKAIFKPKILNILVVLITPYLAYPLYKMGYKFFDVKAANFFVEMVNKAMEERKRQNFKQSDLLQLMMDAHIDLPTEEDMQDEELMGSIKQDDFGKWSSKGLTAVEISAQATLFFLAGYETTATTLSFLLYHLAVNPEIQEKLLAEVDQVTGRKNITPDMVSQLNYMEQCIMETLRLHSPAPRVNREASEPVVVGGISLPKGMRVDIAVNAIHYDPKIYPEPEKFIPDRFSPEEKAKRDPIAWLPFGTGPRNCIGLRLAMLELKVAAARILQNLKLLKCDKTEVPIKFKLGAPVNPVTIKVEVR